MKYLELVIFCMFAYFVIIIVYTNVLHFLQCCDLRR